MERLLRDISTAVQATITASSPLDEKSAESVSDGISLLLLRPRLLLASLHDLVMMTAWRLIDQTSDPQPIGAPALLVNPPTVSSDNLATLMQSDLLINRELLDKVRGLESKLEYQIKKLMSLAEASEKQQSQIPIEEDPLSFRPNPAALLKPKVSTSSAEQGAEVYKPPRIAAMPFVPAQRQRRAPALLSEFAETMDGAPWLESTSGLSVRPVQANRYTNSVSAKRAAELDRMNKFEEENMTRLVTTKREAKRRREDEEALALGYGVGGPARSRGRRQNGLEAELEGVLGDRRARGVWEGVKALNGRGSVIDRATQLRQKRTKPY